MLTLGSIGSVYDRAIEDTGREPEFLFFLSFVCSFGFIRTSAHMIRAQVSWWPGNVQVGSTHIHHLVWGILLLLFFGYIGVVVDPGAPLHQITIVLFGVGTGLTLDEFALWLNLRDVYWEKEGRRSIDAVLVAAGLAGLAVVGVGAWVEVAGDVEEVVEKTVVAAGVVGIVAALVNATKEKFGMVVLSIVFPPAGIVGAFRLGKPASIWAHHLYGEKKMSRSRQRFG